MQHNKRSAVDALDIAASAYEEARMAGNTARANLADKRAALDNALARYRTEVVGDDAALPTRKHTT